ncbi:MAG: hypothetical protein ABI047_12345 [Jatrophihabitantaceae bacterium]
MSSVGPAPSEQAIQDGVAKLEQLRISGMARSITKFALKSLKKSDPEALVTSVRAALRDLEAIGTVLRQVLEDGKAARHVEAVAEPYGRAWIGELRDRLDDIEKEAGVPARSAAWLEAWTAELLVSHFDACDRIVKLRPADSDIVASRLERITGGLRPGGRLITTLQEAKAVLAEERLPVTAAVALSVLVSRGEQRMENLAEAAGVAEAGYQRLEQDTAWPIRALAIAGLAELRLAAERLEEAHELLDTVPGALPSTLDLLIVTGRLAAREGLFSRANEIFDVAASTFGVDATRSDLLREIPGNLIWRTARRVRLNDRDAALELFNRALEATIVGDSSAPQRRARAERAELLEELGRSDEAARDYQLAGTQYFQSKPGTTVRLLAKATSLAPEVSEYQLWYGEALRVAAAGAMSATASVSRLRDAKRALAKGLRGGVAADKAWALVSAALVMNQLATVSESDGSDDGAGDEDGGIDPTVDADALIERALLLDKDDPRTLGFLLYLLRAQGHPKDALQDVDLDAGRRTGEEFLTLYSAMVLSDLDRDADAVRLIEGYFSTWPSTTDLNFLLANARLRCGDPEKALDSLEDNRDPHSSVLRATCLRVAGRESEARTVLRATLSRPETAEDLRLSAWIAYLLGDVDEALGGYIRWLAPDADEVKGDREPADTTAEAGLADSEDDDVTDREAEAEYALLTRQPVESDPVVWLDQAQMLLLRGRENDLEQGEQMARQAISACTEIGGLVNATSIEFPLLRDAVRDSPQEEVVIHILAALFALAQDRCDDLRSRTRDQGRLGPRLGHARRLLSTDDPERAFIAYAELCRHDGPPESAVGLDRATAALLGTADAQAADDPTAGVARWQAIEDLFARHVPQHVSVERRQVTTRLALAALETNGADDGTAALFGTTDVDSVLDALPMFVHDVGSAWAHYDGLRVLAERHPELSGLASVSDRMPLGSVYGLHRDRSAVGATPVVETAIALTLGRGHAGLVGSDEIGNGVRTLRDRLAARFGVRIPGAQVALDKALPALAARVTVYGEEAADLVVPFDADNDHERILEILAERLGDNMFRFVTNDDIDLWVVGWDSDFASHDFEDELSWVTPDPAARARLGWILRTLLREGLPITERVTILQAFSGAEARDSSSPLESLKAVRRALYPATLGPHSATKAQPLPDGLSARLAEGLRDGSAGAWELPRDKAIALIADVNKWRRGRAGAISVTDSGCRLALWRLLAAERPRVYVLSADETP